GAQGYYLTVGTTQGGYDLVNTGTLPSTQSTYLGPALPTGQTLWARIYTKLNNNLNQFADISFTAAPGQAAFSYPTNGATNVDTTQPFAWTTATGAQGYYLTVGTTQGGYDLINSGTLPSTQSTYLGPALPGGRRVARIYTKTNNDYSPYQDISFSAAPGQAVFTNPTNGQSGVATNTTFAWSTVTAAQGYYLTVGTTTGGYDVINTGTLPASQGTYHGAALPAGQTLHARLYTKTNGNYSRYQDIT